MNVCATLERFQISPRRALRPGDLFRTIREAADGDGWQVLGD
jgi:hypothetical protein